MSNEENGEQPQMEMAENSCPMQTVSNVENSKRPSLENPTWDYLFNKYTKSQLQKHCRKIGINRIWVTKDKLVDLIMQKYRTRENIEDLETHENQTLDLLNPLNPLDKVLVELAEIKEILAKKDDEIVELNIMLKTAHVTINKLNDRVTNLENKITHQSASAPEPRESEKTLLLGDGNLRNVRVSDLVENCSVRTIKDATMDLMKCWVNEKLDWTPSKCIIYCGSHDMNENENLISIFDDLGSLISEFKSKSESVELFVCELAPSLEREADTKITQFNERLHEWSNVNGVQVIKTNMSFRLGTGEVDQMCFNQEEEQSHMVLNRYGAIRLLDTIAKQYPDLNICISRKELMHNYRSQRNINKNDENKQIHHTVQDDKNNFHKVRNFRQERATTIDSHTRYSQPSWHPQNRIREVKSIPVLNERFQNNPQRNQRPSNNNHGYPKDTNVYRWRPISSSQDREASYYPRPYRSQEDRDTMDMDRNNRRRGCYNCGEYNHRQNICRFDHRLKCGNCYGLGHKQKMCLAFCN